MKLCLNKLSEVIKKNIKAIELRIVKSINQSDCANVEEG